MEDKLIQDLIKLETIRQESYMELIASENYVSKDVMKATGSILTNKYAEGYPGKRYYNGCQYIDKIENIAINRLKKLFNVKFVNVQPHSGSQANAAAISALIKPGDKILGMSLDSGGHLTHGYKINFSGIFFNSETYEVEHDGFINYENVLKKAKEVKPDVIICGYSAYSRKVDFKKFRMIADVVGSKLIVDISHIAGLVATGFHSSPVEYADIITSTTHKTLRGARGGVIMTNNEEYSKKIDRWVFPGFQGGPLMHSIAGKAVSFGEALKPEFKKYIGNVVNNSKEFAQAFIQLGVKVISNGTDTHLFILDVKSSYGITGKEASSILQSNFITVNKNTIPYDSESPFVTSGIRIGTAAMTTRGMDKKDFILLAKLMDKALKTKEDVSLKVQQIINKIKK